MNKWLKIFLIILAIVIVLAIVAIPIGWTFTLCIANGNSWAACTGLGEFAGPVLAQGQEYYRGKTLWDWLELLIIPAVLAGGALLFNFSERRSERETADRRQKTEHEIVEARQQEDALQNYLDKMTELLLREGLLAKKGTEDAAGAVVVDVAQVRTVTTLRILDERHRNILLQFLRDASLIDFLLRGASLSGADLKCADFRDADLTKAVLADANLTGAILNFTDLAKADLEGANLRDAVLIGTKLSEAYLVEAHLNKAVLVKADLNRAKLTQADLSGAVLFEADLNRADLFDAILIEANLCWANLTGSNVTYEQLAAAILDENTTMPDGTKYKGPTSTPPNKP